MQNSRNHINVSTKILITLLLFLSLIMAKSIYLIIFMTILILILFILSEKSVKHYVYLVKKLRFWLLFILVIYIIISRDIKGSIIFFYKLIIIVCIIRQFCFTVNFQSLNNGIMTLLRPLKRFNVDLEKVSIDITKTIYFLWYYIKSSDFFEERKEPKFKFSLKYYILPRVFLSISEIKKLNSSLKMKFYKPRYENSNIKSNMFLFTFLVLFIVIFFKEVIL